VAFQVVKKKRKRLLSVVITGLMRRSAVGSALRRCSVMGFCEDEGSLETLVFVKFLAQPKKSILYQTILQFST
jgi:hypothetical protein